MKNGTDKEETDVFSLDSLFENCLEIDQESSSEFSHFHKNFPAFSERFVDEVLIAHGGMKSIYKVFDQSMGRHLAMAKLIKNDDENSYMPFIREARLTANLEHPNIIKVHEIGFYEERKPYFTMELKTGDNLNVILKRISQGADEYRERYDQRHLLTIFLKVCDAISYSHSRKVIHLDIKPENIQVGQFGEVQVCDWGLAKIIGLPDKDEDERSSLNPDLLNSLTLNSEIKGTPGYMAPEQIHKEIPRDQRTDIYALGALLYAILTFRNPIDGDVETILQKTVEGKLIPPDRRVPENSISEGLVAVVSKAMSLKMDDRYQSVKELIADINKFLDGFSPHAENAGLFKELTLFYRRNNKICLTVIASVLLIIISSLFFINRLKESRDKAVFLKDEALMNLDKYQREKKHLDSIMITEPSLWINLLKNRLFVEINKDPESTMNELAKAFQRISETNKNHKPLYEIKGEVHFIRQEFVSSLKAMEKGWGRDATSNKLIFKTLEEVVSTSDEGAPASLETVLKVLELMNGHFKYLIVSMVYYDSKIRGSHEDHVLIVKKLISTLNPKWNPEGFEYSAEKRSLKFIGNLKTLSTRFNQQYGYYSLIDTLKVDYLDLREVNKINIQSLTNIRVKTLDLRGHKITILPDESVAEKILYDENLVTPELIPLMKAYNSQE